MNGESIQAIAIDGANRKWIGTVSNGIYLLSADGKETIHHFTEKKSPLLSYSIESIAIHPNSGEVFMSETNFLTYKGKPLVRKGKEIYYGDMSEKYIVRFEILSSKKDGNLEIADKVSVQLLDSNTDKPMKDRIVKDSTKDNLFTALDLGFTWLERNLKA